MIRNEAEYREAVARLQEEAQRLEQQRSELETMQLNAEEIKRVLDPVRSFHAQLREEVESYERLKRGEFDELRNLMGIGRMLVGLRIALNVTQRELARRLQVDESQVSRDERNEYHNVTVEKAARVLEALGVQTTTTVNNLPKPQPPDSAAA